MAICLTVLCIFSAASAGEDKYVKGVREFADNVLEHGRDKYGPKHTPLFVDGLNVDTREPGKWKRGGKVWIVSNLASQQNLFRTLDGLSKLTGDAKYRKAAVDATKYAFANLRSRNGLLHWGGHTLIDAATESVACEGYTHELKCNYPYYALMWEVDPKATRQLIESFWNSHILDWSNLDMNRHGSYTRKMGALWKNEYKGGKVFFVGRGLTFINTGSDLFYSAAMLHKFTGEKEPLVWAKRLAHRYVETRNPKTGLGGYQYSRVSRDRAVAQFGPEFGERLLEGTMLSTRTGGVINGAVGICRMSLAETLGEAGKDFLQWAVEDLTAYGKHAYAAKDNSLAPMITDGTKLTGYALKRNGYYGPKGKVFTSRQAGGTMLWAYAKAFRLTGEPFIWQMARDIAKGNGLGDIGETSGGKPQLNMAATCSDPAALLGVLDLHRKTGRDDYLKLARRIGDNILSQRFHKGLFVASEKHLFAKFDRVEPLALLHLSAAMQGKLNLVPLYTAGGGFFHCPFDGIGRTYDNATIYGRLRE